MQLERNGNVIQEIRVNKNKITLKINDEKLSISKEAYLSMYLYVGKPITDKDIVSLKEITSISKALSYILGRLSKRRYSVKEVTKKLQSKNLNSSQISSILEILESKNLLNDDLMRKEILLISHEKNIGKNRVNKELEHKGLVPNVEAFTYSDELRKCKSQVRVLNNKFLTHSNNLRKAKIISKLKSLGFENEIIQEAMVDYISNTHEIELKNLEIELQKARIRHENKFNGKLLKEKTFAYLKAKGYELNDIKNIWEDLGYEDDS